MPNYHDPFSPKAGAKPVVEGPDGGAAEPVTLEGPTDNTAEDVRAPEAASEAPAPPASSDDTGTASAPEKGAEVPAGTTKEVLAWVGDDKERAQQALDAENSSDEPRKGLVKQLEERLA